MPGRGSPAAVNPLVGLMRLLSDDDVLPLVAGSDFAAAGVRRDLLHDVDCGPTLRVYAALTDGRLGADLTAEDRLYNRYFWFCRFANLHSAKFGLDAGIEQQTNQILEHANCDLDWSQIEKLERDSLTARDAVDGSSHL